MPPYSPKSATLAVKYAGCCSPSAAQSRSAIPQLLLVSNTLAAFTSPCTMPSVWRCIIALTTSCARLRTVDGSGRPSGPHRAPRSKASRKQPCREAAAWVIRHRLNPSGRILHYMICHSKKCHRSSRHKNSKIEEICQQGQAAAPQRNLTIFSLPPPLTSHVSLSHRGGSSRGMGGI